MPIKGGKNEWYFSGSLLFEETFLGRGESGYPAPIPFHISHIWSDFILVLDFHIYILTGRISLPLPGFDCSDWPCRQKNVYPCRRRTFCSWFGIKIFLKNIFILFWIWDSDLRLRQWDRSYRRSRYLHRTDCCGRHAVVSVRLDRALLSWFW